MLVQFIFSLWNEHHKNFKKKKKKKSLNQDENDKKNKKWTNYYKIIKHYSNFHFHLFIIHVSIHYS